MEETAWKLHASKTPVRKLKPLRNCAALNSKIRAQQERSRQSTSELSILDPLLEQWQSTAGTDPGAVLTAWKHAATSPHFLKMPFFSPERKQIPSQPFSWPHEHWQQVQPLDGRRGSRAPRVRNLGLAAGTFFLQTSRFRSPRGTAPPPALLFSSVKQRCDVAKYNKVYLHKLRGHPCMKTRC